MTTESDLEKFISGLSDHELSIFVGYRYYGFISESREKIITEVKKRNLTSTQLEKYFNERLNQNSVEKSNLCSKCGSEKVFTEKDFEQQPRMTYLTTEVEIETKRCRLCNFNPAKEKPKNIKERISRIFKKHKAERIVNWSTW